MPRYFFHLEDGTCINDDGGVELADEIEARRWASSMLTDLAQNRTLRSSWDVLVTNAAGEHLFRISLKSISKDDDGATH